VALPLVGDGYLTAVVGKPRRYFYHPLFAHYLTEGFGLLEGSDFSLPKKKLTHQKMFPKKAEKNRHIRRCALQNC